MDRRAFLGALTGSLLTVPLAARAQPAGRMPRIGVLFPAEPASPTEPNTSAFRQGLRDLGYVEGKTIAVEYRYAHGRTERYAELAQELVQLKVDVLVAGVTRASRPGLQRRRSRSSVSQPGILLAPVS